MAHGSRLMAHDSWLMAHDSWRMAHGPWLMADKKIAAGSPRPWALAANYASDCLGSVLVVEDGGDHKNLHTNYISLERSENKKVSTLGVGMLRGNPLLSAI